MLKRIKNPKLKRRNLLNQVKVLGVAASPRRNANTETLLDSALKGAKEEGARTEKVILNLLRIRPCQACAKCSETATCYIKDDMQGLLKKLKTCDALIIASPVYFGTVTAQLKTMIDRCQPAWAEKYIFKKRFPKKRRGMFISVSSYRNKNFFRNSKEIISILFTVLGIRLSSELCIPCLENKDDMQNNLLLSRKAFLRGQSLVRSIRPCMRAKE